MRASVFKKREREKGREGNGFGEEEQQIPSENDLSSRRQKHSATAVNSPKVADSGKALCFGLDLNTCNRHRQLPARFPETSRPAPAN